MSALNICVLWAILLYVILLSVSAKGFYKSQDVIPDFLCEILGVTAQNLQDPRFHLDKRKLENAIRGND